jgi:hypothetical protein
MVNAGITAAVAVASSIACLLLGAGGALWFARRRLNSQRQLERDRELVRGPPARRGGGGGGGGGWVGR